MQTSIDKEILKKVELIRILTRQSVTSLFSGEFESAFKGQGLEFQEVREYLPGDEIRSIDWNVTAKTGYPHIKRFREERELSIYFLVDVSPSSSFGSGKKSRSEIAAEIVSVLSFSASMNNDRTGLLLFSDQPELFIPLSKGMNHTLQMVRQMLAYKPERKKTSISAALEFIGKVAQRRSVIFLLSDFYDTDYLDQIKIAARKHDVVNIYLFDPKEKILPSVGLINFIDSETGKSRILDTSNKKVRAEYEKRFTDRLSSLEKSLRKYGCDFLSMDITKEYVHILSQFFLRRERRK
jgi:uncharacterized protein (DUF58 family)